MLYPFGWLTPDLQTSAPAQPSIPPSPGISQQRARAKARLTNSPQLAGTMLKLAFSSPPALAQLLPANTAEATGPASASPDTVTLRLGSQGEAVRVLQTRLQTLDFYNSEIDGLFGPLTAEAVRNFQQAEQLQVDGVVGPATWKRLFAASLTPTTTDLPQRSNLAAPRPNVEVAGPIFSPGMVPQLSFHPIAVVPDETNSKVALAIVLVVSSLGIAALGFRTKQLTPAAAESSSAQQTEANPAIPAPKPVYWGKQATIHYPKPVYPHKPVSTSAEAAVEAVAEPAVEGTSLTLSRDTLTSTSQPRPEDAEATDSELLNTATEQYLPSFLYDLFQPSSRYQLEAVVQGLMDAPSFPEPPQLSALLQRVGVFPNHNPRTGLTYTYMLLDDVGGCFRLCDNELWVTHVASRWLQHDVPYTATIRRIDSAGRVLDKEFTVALSRYQLEMAS